MTATQDTGFATVRRDGRTERVRIVDRRRVPAVASPFPDRWPGRPATELVRLQAGGPWFDAATGRVWRE